MSQVSEDLWFMNIALEEAERAYDMDEVPVGAVLVSDAGEVLAKAHNLKEQLSNPCGHAEIIAIQKAAKEIEGWRLTGFTLYVTLEPCLMCLGAVVQSRIKRVVFGSYDKKGGALSLGYYMHKDKRLNHRFSVTGGVGHYECSKILSSYFKEKRQNHKYNTAIL